MKSQYQILIIGGGTAGIMVASQLKKRDKNLKIAIVEPSDTHYYQPAWTLVGAGTYNFSKTARPMKKLIPNGVSWVRDSVTRLVPELNYVETKGSGALYYDYLVVAAGLVSDPSLIEGLPEALEKGVATSIYMNPEETWKTIKNFKGGNALFTQPATPIKCGGAPQKIAYLAADNFRKRGVLKDSNVIFATPGTVIFGIEQIRKTLEKVIRRYGIKFKPYHTPVKIDADKKVAYFKLSENKQLSETENDNVPGIFKTEDQLTGIPFELLHLAPPQKPPKFVNESELANDSGWLDVDQYSMQHKKFANVFGLGDVAGLPTAKTGAAIRKQAPVVVDNVLKLLSKQEADNNDYNGYSSCPLVTGYGKMVLAEFDYQNRFTPDPKLKQMLIFDSSKEHWRLWILKKYGLPYLYWNKMMKGKEV